MNLENLRKEAAKITRARHPLEIKYFVVGQHENKWRQWYQLCIEFDAKWSALEENEANVALAILETEKRNVEIEIIKNKNSEGLQKKLDEIEIKKLEVKNEQTKRQLERSKSLVEGAKKEIQDLFSIAQSEFKEFFNKSEEELCSAYEKDYWISRLGRQIAVDMLTFGQIQPGNLECLMKLPEKIKEAILIEAAPRIQKHISQIQSVNKLLLGNS